MTHTPDEIAAMIERLEHMSKNTRDEYLHELAGRSAAMLREVAAERDALAERVNRKAGNGYPRTSDSTWHPGDEM